MRSLCILGKLLLILLALEPITYCKDSTKAQDFMAEDKFECHHINGTERVRYLYRCFYNKEETVYFDSDVGKFIAKTELGRPDADYWNSDKDIIEQKKAEVETFCKYNYGIWEKLTVDRKIEPSVTITVSKQYSDSQHHSLYCNTYGFYPPEIEVKWFRNNVEETSSVEYSTVYQNPDWTYQFMVMLETPLNRGDIFTCEVLHSSLQSPLRVYWKPEASESAHNKKVTGIVGMVLGAIFFIVGLTIYMRSKKVRFGGLQSESFLAH